MSYAIWMIGVGGEGRKMGVGWLPSPSEDRLQTQNTTRRYTSTHKPFFFFLSLIGCHRHAKIWWANSEQEREKHCVVHISIQVSNAKCRLIDHTSLVTTKFMSPKVVQEGYQRKVSHTTETSHDPPHNTNRSNDMVGKSSVVVILNRRSKPNYTWSHNQLNGNSKPSTVTSNKGLELRESGERLTGLWEEWNKKIINKHAGANKRGPLFAVPTGTGVINI